MSAKITTTELAAIITSGNAVIVEALRGLTAAIQGSMTTDQPKVASVTKMHVKATPKRDAKLDAKLDNAKKSS